MKVSLFAAAAGAAAVLFALPAAAQISPSFYGNLGYSAINADGADLGAATGRLGARLHPYFGVEAEAGIGVVNETTTVGGVAVKAELEHSVAAYGVAFLPVNDQLDLIARVGYGSSKIEASAAGVSLSDSEESWNYGVGAQYSFDGANGIRGDYTRHDFGNGAGEADVWAVSYVRKF